jgi:hypothetical protein
MNFQLDKGAGSTEKKPESGTAPAPSNEMKFDFNSGNGTPNVSDSQPVESKPASNELNFQLEKPAGQ